MREDILTNELVQPLETEIIDQLETIFDPEIGLDIYNLGLIYELTLSEDKQLAITLTFTGVACSCIETVPVELVDKLTQINGIDSVDVNIVWDPVWSLERISRLGRMTLGINPN